MAVPSEAKRVSIRKLEKHGALPLGGQEEALENAGGRGLFIVDPVRAIENREGMSNDHAPILRVHRHYGLSEVAAPGLVDDDQV